MAPFHPTQTGSSIDSATQLGIVSATVTSLARARPFDMDVLGFVPYQDGGDAVLGAVAAALGQTSRRG